MRATERRYAVLVSRMDGDGKMYTVKRVVTASSERDAAHQAYRYGDVVSIQRAN